jgi:pectate lyase
VGLYVRRVSNVILRNLKIGQVDADNGDAIGIDASSNVWVDHCDLSGDLSAGKDDLDGLLDITHGSEWVTVSNTYFHDHVSTNPAIRTSLMNTDNLRAVERLLDRAQRQQ